MNDTTETKTLVHTVVQVRLPARDIDESVAWYEKYFGFAHCWKTEEESDLKLEPGPYLFLKRVEQPTPIHIVSQGRPYAVLCIKTSNVFECYRRFIEAGEEVTEITYTWNIDRFPEFNVTDPTGNVINVANYPDLQITGF
ncbi:putative enzyme related to lactoylglutathione lyase [Paenibacillus cellulosilyticus]|uniref:Putative enzyme related to lactoylglutathione lyase n=1 Tax=Paenibacillus cellulosilyticus TaxID=375489 RepID=A0A2V2Z0D0_9BACL|nr:VOC family protein [Paenibacillus cellulosilyticus]PWW06495.1 putative enzyme related to lactoylglutathione lyase [Paenibacillus cellulosilyticus]QKS46166.1 VOC family protein [Paenibacillus cellulosilyticus]